MLQDSKLHTSWRESKVSVRERNGPQSPADSPISPPALCVSRGSVDKGALAVTAPSSLGGTQRLPGPSTPPILPVCNFEWAAGQTAKPPV